jgi:hypothetical protein
VLIEATSCRPEDCGQFFCPQCFAGSHSAPRSRLSKISCQAASRPIGLPQIRIEVGPRCWGGEVSSDSDRAGVSLGCSATDAFTGLPAPFAHPSVRSSISAPRGESTTCRMRGACRFVEPLANQHFVPLCPGSCRRHVACDPGCAFHTASALGRHSLRAGTDNAASMATMRRTRMILPPLRYTL